MIRNFTKNVFKRSLFVLLGFLFLWSNGIGQTTLYSEDFSSNTGKGQTEGVLDVSGVTNWSIDVSNGDFTNHGDIETFNVTGGVWLSHDSDAPDEANSNDWFSTVTNITSFTNVTISADLIPLASSSSNFIRMYYSLDGAAFLPVGAAVDGNDLSVTRTLAGQTGSTMQIKISYWGTSSTGSISHDNVTIVGTPPPCGASTAPTALVSTPDETTMDITWTDPTTGDGVIVIMRETVNPAAAPVDFTPAYSGDLNFGDGDELGSSQNYVIYSGNLATNNVTVTGLVPGRSYTIDVYSQELASPCYFTTPATSVVSALRSTNYYVNNGILNIDDIHTTAIGNDANIGTRPDVPMRYLTSLLATYGGTFLPGDTIFIDAGLWLDTDPTQDRQMTISDNGLTIVGAGIGKTIYDNNFDGATGYYFMNVAADDFTISEMSIWNYGLSAVSGFGHAFTFNGVANALVSRVELFRNGYGSSGLGTVLVKSNSSVTFAGGGNACNATPGAQSYGGGISVDGTSITLNINNYAMVRNYHDVDPGPAIWIYNADNTTTVNLNNVLIDSCVSGGAGGGAITMNDGNLNITDCKITRNEIDDNSIQFGAALYINGGTVVIKRSTITENKESNPVGSLRVSGIGLNGTGINLTVDSCLFENNSTSDYCNDIFAQGNGNTILCRNTTFNSAGLNIGYTGASTFTIADCGEPKEYLGNPITKSNIDNPTYAASPSVPTFSGNCTDGVDLPIELTYFHGNCRDGQIVLNWQTASEINNDYFLIEKTSDFETYQKVAYISGAGNSTTLLSYQFVDPSPNFKERYYRLSQYDFDGTETKYNAIVVETKCLNAGFNFSTFYNADVITVSYNAELDAYSTFELIDLNGKILCAWSYRLFQDAHQINLDLQKKLSEGIYFLRIRNDYFSKTEKFYLVNR